MTDQEAKSYRPAILRGAVSRRSLGTLNLMGHERKPKQKTEKGLEIPVPTKGDFDEAMRKVAPPAGRKDPGGKDERRERSE